MIRFSCPQCHAPLKAPEKNAGFNILCPACKYRLAVPSITVNQPVPVEPGDMALFDDIAPTEGAGACKSIVTEQPKSSRASPARPVPKWLWVAGGGVVLVCLVCAGVLGSIIGLNVSSGRDRSDANEGAKALATEKPRDDRAAGYLLVGEWWHTSNTDIVWFNDDQTFSAADASGMMIGQWSIKDGRIHHVVKTHTGNPALAGTAFDLEIEKLSKKDLWLKSPLNGWVDRYQRR